MNNTRVLITRERVWHPQRGMELRHSRVWNQAADNAPSVMPYRFADAMHADA
jgi:hypothetical protein